MRAGPRECGLGGIALAIIAALARGWPPELWYLALVALAASPAVAQVALERFLPPSLQAAPVLGAELLMTIEAPIDDPSPLLLLWLAANVGFSASCRAGVAVTAASTAVVVGAELLRDGHASLLWSVGFWMSCIAGLALQEQERTVAALEQAQAELAERAAVEERRRVAREVHDVLAHTLAVTMLHLTGARLALADGDTAEAEAGLREAERLGRDSLVGLRRTVGLLTRDEGATAVPAPDLGRLQDLVREYVAGGADVALEVAVDGPVPEEVGLAAYRIVQESLANAVRHAPGAQVRVDVAAVGRELRLEVLDSGAAAGGPPSPGTTQGLAGMAERAALLGGRCTAGPRHDAPGWRVSAVLPLPEACPLSARRAARAAGSA